MKAYWFPNTKYTKHWCEWNTAEDVYDYLFKNTNKQFNDSIFNHIPQEYIKPEYRKSTNNQKEKEDDNMNQTTKTDGIKNRMGVFAKGISFDTPSGTTQYIIPQIKEIKAINNRVVIIKFKDGTQEKAVLDSSDTFSIEQGVAICITKKILSKLTYGNGSSVYNKLINYAMKIYKKQESDKAKAEEEKIKTEQQDKKHEEKKKKKAEKVQAQDKEELVNILSEAISKAMQSMNYSSPVRELK